MTMQNDQKRRPGEEEDEEDEEDQEDKKEEYDNVAAERANARPPLEATRRLPRERLPFPPTCSPLD